MAKRKKIITAGNLVAMAIYPMHSPQDGHRARAAKHKLSSAAQKAMNAKNTARQLEYVLAANFAEGSSFVTLTYDDARLPVAEKTSEIRSQAKKDFQRFIRKLRDGTRKQGETLKYVYCTENMENTPGQRIHFHMVVKGATLEQLRTLWGCGNVDVQPINSRELGIDGATDRYGNINFGNIAAYMTKEVRVGGKPNGAQAWTASRNCERPKVVTEIVPDETGIEPPPEAHVLERETIVNEYGSYSFIKYILLPQAPLINGWRPTERKLPA